MTAILRIPSNIGKTLLLLAVSLLHAIVQIRKLLIFCRITRTTTAATATATTGATVKPTPTATAKARGAA